MMVTLFRRMGEGEVGEQGPSSFAVERAPGTRVVAVGGGQGCRLGTVLHRWPYIKVGLPLISFQRKEKK